mgnify:CR=1 FL=1
MGFSVKRSGNFLHRDLSMKKDSHCLKPFSSEQCFAKVLPHPFFLCVHILGYSIECYLSTEASYQEIAIALGLNNPTLLVRWTKEYRSGGVDALRPKPKGRAPTMPKQRKERLQDSPQDETAQQLKALQDENLRLRIEIAYLKELRRLRLQEKMQSKRQGSSTASEENFS